MFGSVNLKKSHITMGVGAFLGSFAAVGTVLVAGGCGSGGNLIAMVNREAITIDDYYKFLELKPDVRVRTENGSAVLPVEGALGFQALQDLIGQRLTVQLAKDEGVMPTEADIIKELDFQKKLDPTFVTRLTQRGLTLDTIKQSLTVDLAQERLLTKDIEVTMDEVERHIKRNQKSFIEPAKADVSWILVRSPQVKRHVDRELASGQSFTAVALRYSEAPNNREWNAKIRDPRMGPPAINSLPPDIQQAINRVQAPGQTEWITLVDGEAKLYVHTKQAERPVVMDDLKKEALRRMLARQKGAQARDIQKHILEKLKASEIQIMRPSYQEPWKQAYEEFTLQDRLRDRTGAE
jgi:parvulin-like peptidyl-prolyl isomerase